ncbi:MAG: flagellar basal body P-ring protein FlgI [Oligoflexales bacterium]
MQKMVNRIFFVACLSALSSVVAIGQKVRIKDLARLKGVRENRLTGYGLVVGLQGTGDSAASLLGQKTMQRFLKRFGVSTGPEDIVAGSYSVVLVTTELTPYARIGDKLKVNLSTQGDTSSLAGGTLLSTPLLAANGETYAIAHGQVSVGQADGVGSRILTVASIPEGGIVEKEHLPDLLKEKKLEFSLKDPDFSTNHAMTKAINLHFKGFYARSLDIRGVEVLVPEHFQDDPIHFLSRLEKIQVDVDQKAIVIINERTGTVVMGHQVKIDPIVISHGDLSLKIGEDPSVGIGKIDGSDVATLMDGLNAFGARSVDLVSILQAIDAAGALRGELKLI